MGEGGGGFGEEHDAEARDEKIEGGCAEIMRGGVGQHEFRGAAEFRGARSCAGNHGGGNVDAERAAGCAGLRGGIEGRCAAAAADIQDAFARLYACDVQHRSGEGLQHAVETVLETRPAFAHIAVPVVDLVGVRAGGGEGRGRVHGARSCDGAPSVA